MEFPSELRFAIEQMLAGQDIKAMTASAEGISKRYRSESGTGRSLVSSQRDTLAYAAVRMPATFGAVSRALELTMECCNAEISSVLDIGAGTGAASHAAQLVTGCGNITCIEREESMISLGKQLMQARGISAQWIKRDISAADFDEKADMVLSSYCLNELSPSSREKAIQRLWNAAGKLLVIVEPGTPEGFRQLCAARKQLMALGGFVAAPCPSNGECTLPADDWCHFTARVARTRLHKQLKSGEAPYEDEKFCFIAVSRAEVCGAARVIRHPKIESGRITLRLCTAEGICDKLVTRKNPLFKAARKSDCGDRFDEIQGDI